MTAITLKGNWTDATAIILTCVNMFILSDVTGGKCVLMSLVMMHKFLDSFIIL